MKRAQPAQGPAVTVECLAKTYQQDGGPVRAVRGVDLVIEHGEFVAVTGPSGAGKSTLLHLLGGLIRPDRGRIFLDGRRVEGLSEARWAVLRRRHVGIVFQLFNLISTLTVADNIELQGLLAGRSPRQVRAACAELLTELGLENRAESTPADLSGGERQRVALARALINQPSLLLADEPTGSLDSKGTREVLRLLSRYHRRGQTIMLVTHDASVAATADRVITLFDGEIVDDARLDDDTTADAAAAAHVVRLLG